MSFTLDGTVNEELVLGILIEKMRRSLVGGTALRVHNLPGGASSIKIPKINDFGTQDYNGTDLTITAATDASVILLLDKHKAFAKTVDMVDDEESAIEVISSVLEGGAYALAKAADEDIFTTLATTTNIVTTVAIDKTNVVATITELGVSLDDKDVPRDEGRKLYVSPKFSGALAEANLSYDATTNAEAASVNGFIGHFGGFDIYMTNSLSDGTNGKWVIACHDTCADFGQSLQTSDIVKTEKSFKWLIKGLSNYGSIVSNADGIVKVDVS